MEEALVALMLRSGALTALVSNRVNWLYKPQGDAGTPYVVLQKISVERIYTNEGPSGYARTRVQADLYGQSYSATKKAARALIAAIEGRRTGIFQGIFIDSERDLPAADAGEVTHLFRTSVDLMIHHSE